MTSLSIIGCGFVSDLYMRSLATFSDLSVGRVYDRDSDRLKAFCAFWKTTPANSLEDMLGGLAPGSIVLNLTNPSSHYEVSQTCLKAGHHVYSEKPLATEMDQAHKLHALAKKKGLLLMSAPCSSLSESAQIIGKAVRDGVAGTPRLVYAELDDGFVSQAPYREWVSESGAPWPHEDEFITGCTLEHAGYYLSWLIAIFGPVRRVIAASAALVPDKSVETETPDYSVASLFFESGVVARLTCSIVAPHDHQIRIIGDKGVLAVKKAWDNSAPVRFHKRFRLRRRLMESPVGKRIRLKGATHPKLPRRGAAAMNFALGPKEMADALAEGRECRLSSDFALHLNEVTLAIQNAGEDTGPQDMKTRCDLPEPMPWAQ